MPNDFEKFNQLATKDDLKKMKEEITRELGDKLDTLISNAP
jgi:hypothetical protein